MVFPLAIWFFQVQFLLILPLQALLHLLDRVSFKVADHYELVEILQKMEMVAANLTFIGKQEV